MEDMEYVPVTDLEIGDRIFTAFRDTSFVITDIEEVEVDWAGEKPIGADTLIQITFDADSGMVFKFRKVESLWRIKE